MSTNLNVKAYNDILGNCVLLILYRALDCDQNGRIFECASKNLTWSHLCECMVCAAQPQHIVAGERFHWSREERRFQNERFSRAWLHTARVSRAEAAQKRRVCRAGAARAHCAFTCRVSTSAKVRATYAQRMESNGGFGFQTKVKDRFLNQRRWTCWYSCRESMQVLSATASLVLLYFCFRFEKLVIFAVYLTLHYGGFPYFLNIIIIWFISVC